MGPTRALLAHPLHPYAQALLQSVPSATGPGGARLLAIPGEPPEVGALASGCPFHPRCPRVMAICRESDPALERNGNAAVACWAAGQDGAVVAATSQKLPDRTVRRDDALVASTEPLLVLDRVTRHYLVPSIWPLARPTRVHAVDDVSLSVRRGEVLGLAGDPCKV